MTASILLLVTDGVHPNGVIYPAERLREEGWSITQTSPDGQPVQGATGGTLSVDRALNAVTPDQYDLLLVPDGLKRPARSLHQRLTEVIATVDIIGAIGTGIEAITDTAVLEGRQVTCPSSLKTPIEGAGGTVLDDPIVVDGPLVTARSREHLHGWVHAVRNAVTTPTIEPEYEPIGVIHSPFSQQIGTPIQPAYSEQVGVIELEEQYAAGLRNVKSFSHLYLIYAFHEADAFDLQPTPFKVDERRGLFGTRAPRRPNPIGLSIVRLEAIDGTELSVSGLDVVDGTPLLDLKPYVPAYDDVPNATGGWLADLPETTRQRADDSFLDL